MKSVRIAILLMVAAVAAGLCAEPTRVSLLTVGPGKHVYELEGHTALRIQLGDSAELPGLPPVRDVAVNWGMFDFNAPNFAYRFIKGETDYSIGVSPMEYFLMQYEREGRRVSEIPLNLTPAQADKVVELIAENLKPENRVYRYNYVKDNCATRPLAIIEAAVGTDGSAVGSEMGETETSFRNEMRMYHKRHPSYQLFIDIALGSGIDGPIANRERAFAPVFLEQYVANAQVSREGSSPRPLGGESKLWLEGPEKAWSEGGLPVGVIVWLAFAVTCLMTVRDVRRRKTTKWFDALFYFVFGTVGCLVAFLVFVSTHEATSPNVNLLWLNPLALIVPLMIWWRGCRKVVWGYQAINLMLIAVFAIGQPFFHQSGNILFVPLVAMDIMRSASYIYLNRK